MLVKQKGDNLILFPYSPLPPTPSVQKDSRFEDGQQFRKGNEACLRNPESVCKLKANAELLWKKRRACFFGKAV